GALQAFNTFCDDTLSHKTRCAAISPFAHIIHRALEQPAPEARWRPIETGPRDWSNVLLFEPEYECICPEDEPCDCPASRNHEERVFQGYFSCADAGSNQWMECGSGGKSCTPTHWQPLPSPPTDALAGSSSAVDDSLTESRRTTV